jgi:transcriptional regulator with XRE-family HTH domain
MNKKLMIEVGKRIKEVRKHLQVNQTDFARRMGMPIKQLSAMETGKITPDFDFLYNVDKYFNVNVLYIIAGKGSVFPPWERPTIKMCEGLLKEYGQEFREFIETIHKSPEICRDVIDHFLIYKVQKNDLIEEDKLRSRKRKRKIRNNRICRLLYSQLIHVHVVELIAGQLTMIR